MRRMATMIPLIRAAALVPHIRWLEARDRPVDAYLADAGVPGDPVGQRERPIPLRATFNFVREAAEREGMPDLGFRVMTEESLQLLGEYGRGILASATVEQALHRAERTMPYFCTHERLELRGRRGARRVTVNFGIDVDQAALHQGQLMTAGYFCSLLSAARPKAPPVSRIQMTPHPRHGFDAMPAELRPMLAESADSTMSVQLEESVLALPLLHGVTRLHPADPAGDWPNLRLQAEFLFCARMLVEGMVEDGAVHVERLAIAAGMSVRTLQRRLAAEGITFSGLVDAARRKAALKAIAEPGTAIAEVANAVGYASPSALTRAVRRWMGQPPRALRK